MTITQLPTIDADDDTAAEAVSEFNGSVGFYGYDAEISTNHQGSREVVVRYDGETLAAFTEGEGDWLEDLASYAYRLENGAKAA